MIVGLQTDVPCKRAMMPNGGWRMVEQAIKEAGKEPDPEIKKIFTKYRKTHNDGVFGVYTKNIKIARHNKILTGLPDAYGRGRIIGDYRRVALYGVNKLIAFKKRDKDSIPYRNDFTEPEIEHWIRFREEHDEQIKALKQLINLGNEYGLDLTRPAQTAQEAVQWTYMGYLPPSSPRTAPQCPSAVTPRSSMSSSNATSRPARLPRPMLRSSSTTSS